MKRALLAGLTFFFLLAAAPPALAHAFLERAAPAVGSTVRAAPAELRLWFNEELEPAFSSVRVFDQSGAQIDRRNMGIDANDASILRVSLPQLASGTYRVVWRVVSTDAHVTQGDFTFRVAP